MNLFLLGQMLAGGLVIELYEKDDTMTTLGANYARVCNTLYWNNKKNTPQTAYIYMYIYIYIYIYIHTYIFNFSQFWLAAQTSTCLKVVLI
jgi:hypothetical protein